MAAGPNTDELGLLKSLASGKWQGAGKGREKQASPERRGEGRGQGCINASPRLFSYSLEARIHVQYCVLRPVIERGVFGVN